MCDIKNLRELVSPFVKPGYSYVGYIAERLTAAGDNYGSLMLAIEVRIKNKNNEVESLHLVAKKIPETKFLQEIFQVQISFKRELQFYDTVIPTLSNFLKEHDLENAFDFFPKYYCGRLNNKPHSDVVDDDGVILMENLKLNGYRTFQRTIGFNLEVSKFLLKDLAVFHAAAVALKLKDPKCFKEKIAPVVSKFDIFGETSEEVKQENFKRLLDMVSESAECSQYLERLATTFKNYSSDEYNEPFATISHNDFWVNNAMLRMVNCKPARSKFLDFQIIDYGSPGKDVIFFIFSSVQPHLVDEHYSELIKTYFAEYIRTLQRLDCDIAPFTFEAFQRELEMSAKKTQLLHLLIMFTPICTEKSDARELKDISKNEDLPEPSILQKERTWFTVQQFAKRNWI